MKRHVPNAITLLNLFLGCCAAGSVFYGQFVQAFWFVFAAVLADYGDGLIARMLGVHSELGKELDSLADMVSFGVVPGVIYYKLLAIGLGHEAAEGLQIAALPGFVLSVFSGLRLAKFNLDTRQAEGFLGLPTPSSTMFTVGVMLIYHFNSFGLGAWVVSPLFLYCCIGGLSYLLLSEIPMFNFKFKSFRWAGNEIKYIFAAMAVAALLLAREAAFSIVVVLYILFSIFRYLAHKGKTV
ncbi:MAG: CDP-alcohol phosphatidyltransferase family protein [Phaeodactylibacter sp.]|nr:CDP-alcohol phosphatidyltransferase family protein [Phaeodactylibacter sp.]MCB9301842.1 CDP-alcohol phosphatidyltransferase family protein [Lewinellaceae bacterium]HQU60758.1 CDP-alcohol phosphatidyltransferase family protein [Saprospiraceae bacterium]